jgi:hypothetical protein
MATLRGCVWIRTLSAVLLVGCGSCDLGEEVESLAGAGASDCGSVAIDGDPSAVDACVVTAMSEGKAFKAEYHRQGDDSKIVSGYAGNDGGQVFILTWDSSPCGGSGCDAVISSIECIGPKLADPNQSRPSPPIDCEETRDQGYICED